MEPLLPATEELFQAQRRQQQHFVRTAEIQKSLRETTVHALAVLDKLALRGETLNEQSVQAETIEASSLAMAKHIQYETESRTWWGWFKRMFCSCGVATPATAPAATQPKTTSRVPTRRVLYFAPPPQSGGK